MTGLVGRRARTVALVLAAAAGSAILAFRWCYEPDLWWHLAHGREIAAGHLPRTNLFSFTHPDYPQPSTSWLFDVGTYALRQLGGASAIQLGQALVLFATLAILYRACRTRAGVAASVAVVVFGWFVLEPRAVPRPHTVSFAGMAACALLVERAQARRSVRPLLGAVPLVLVWSNLHVESIFGLALLGCFAVGALVAPDDETRGLGWCGLLVTALAGAAVLANPYGFGLVQYLVENARVPEVIRIAELQPPYLPNYAPFFLYLFALGALLIRPPLPRLWETLATVLFATLALRHLRFTPLLLCATAPIAAARLQASVASTRFLPLGALFCGLLLARLPPATFVDQLGVGIDALAPAEMMPRGGAEFARRVGLRGRVFNSNNIGGSLVWELYPDTRVFQDSRLQAYPAAHFAEIMAASRSQAQWDALVAGVDWAVLSVPRPNELSGARRFPAREWATVYWDDACEILVRRNGAFAALIDPFEYRVLRPGFDPVAPLPASVDVADRLVAEAQRNRVDDPEGFAAAAWLCLNGDDADACATARTVAARRPELRRAALRLDRLRTARSDADDVPDAEAAPAGEDARTPDDAVAADAAEPPNQPADDVPE